MIKDDLVMKTVMIDKELNKTVAYNTNKFIFILKIILLLDIKLIVIYFL